MGMRSRNSDRVLQTLNTQESMRNAFCRQAQSGATERGEKKKERAFLSVAQFSRLRKKSFILSVRLPHGFYH